MVGVDKNASMLLPMMSAIDVVNRDPTLDPSVDWIPNLNSREVSLQRVYDITFTRMTERRRNELITLAYQDISRKLAQVLGTDLPTWGAFGQWPSNAIGRLLRLPIPMIRQTVKQCFGYGNQGVFYDIGQAFVVFIETMGHLNDASSPLERGAAFEQCLARLQPHAVMPSINVGFVVAPEVNSCPPQKTLAELEPDGKGTKADDNGRHLYRGMWAYASSMEATDPADKAELLFAGNVLLAAHEQWWLQLALATGIRIPIRRILYPSLNRQPRVKLRRTDEYAAGRIGLHRLAKKIERNALHLLTRHVIGFHLGPTWTPVGREPTQPIAANLVDLRVPLAKKVLRSFDDPSYHRSICWLSYDQRMAFITNLFRREFTPTEPLDADEQRVIRHRATGLVPPIPPLREPVPCFDEDEWNDTLNAFRNAVDPLDDALATSPSTPDHEVTIADVTKRVADLTTRHLLSSNNGGGGAEFIRKHRLIVMMGLLAAALPDGFAAARGAKVLDEYSDLITRPANRIAQTLDFVLAVLDGDFAEFDPTQIATIAQVRLQHSRTRRLAEDGKTRRNTERTEPWDTDTYGRPINTEDLFGTVLSFVVPVIETFRRLHISITDTEREAYLHRWCSIGYLMGCDLSLLTRRLGDTEAIRFINEAEAFQMAALIRRRHHRRSIHGVRLTAAMLNDLGDHMPAGLGPVPAILLRAAGDPDVADLLMVRNGPRERFATLVLRNGGRLTSVPIISTVVLAALRMIGDHWKVAYSKRSEEEYLSPAMTVQPPGCDREDPKTYERIPPLID